MQLIAKRAFKNPGRKLSIKDALHPDHVHKGATFEAEWQMVNDEVWLPASFSGHGSARVALFFNHYGVVEEHESDYRKYRASSTILPGLAPVETPASPGGPAQP